MAEATSSSKKNQTVVPREIRSEAAILRAAGFPAGVDLVESRSAA